MNSHSCIVKINLAITQLVLFKLKKTVTYATTSQVIERNGRKLKEFNWQSLSFPLQYGPLHQLRMM